MKLPRSYIDGFLLPIPKDRVPEYRKLAEEAAAIWMKHSALQYTECAADDLDTEWCRRFDETAATQEHPPFPRPPVRPIGSSRGRPQKAIS